MNLFGRSLTRNRDAPVLGIIGGSDLCAFPEIKVIRRIKTKTKYGRGSDDLIIAELGGVRVAFIPRHGPKHTIPPHKVPYKANLAALKSLGVHYVIGTCVVGSLRKEIEPGAFVIPNQFINLTWGRDDTFDIDRRLVHLSMAHPYCERLRNIIARELKTMDVPYQINGTVVVIQGPRFSTVAESKMYSLWGGDIVNMTQYPECYFARELGLCYGAIATVTDYDVGVPSAISMQPGSMETVLAIFRRNTGKTVKLLGKLAGIVKEIGSCNCAAGNPDEYYKSANGDSS